MLMTVFSRHLMHNDEFDLAGLRCVVVRTLAYNELEMMIHFTVKDKPSRAPLRVLLDPEHKLNIFRP